LTDFYHRTPPSYAAERMHEAAVKQLLVASVSVTGEASRGSTTSGVQESSRVNNSRGREFLGHIVAMVGWLSLFCRFGCRPRLYISGTVDAAARECCQLRYFHMKLLLDMFKFILPSSYEFPRLLLGHGLKTPSSPLC
jgi:hypothetical protein